MQFIALTPIPDETDLRTKARDDLVRMLLSMGAERMQLQSRLNEHYAAAQSTVDAADIESAHAALAGATEEVKRARQALESKDAQIAALEADLAKARSELDDATAPSADPSEPAKSKKSK